MEQAGDTLLIGVGGLQSSPAFNYGGQQYKIQITRRWMEFVRLLYATGTGVVGYFSLGRSMTAQLPAASHQ